MNQISVQIIDDFLPDPTAFRNTALAQPYYDIRGPDGCLYRHINVRQTDEFDGAISQRLGKQIKSSYALLRQNFQGETPNNAIHSDQGYDEFAGVLYLNTSEQCRGGTAFWRHKKYGWTSYPTEAQCRSIAKSPSKICRELLEDYNDETKWEQIHLAEMKQGRLIVYPGSQFHSRWPFEAFGDRPETARLIWINFFSRV